MFDAVEMRPPQPSVGREEQSAAAIAPILVVIPARRAERTLRSCVEAALRSTIRERLKIVVADDGGNPNLTQHLAQLPVTVVSTGEAGSAAYARNLGVKHGSGDIVVFLDSDVLVEPDGIEKLVQPLYDGRAEATVGNYSRRLQGLNFAQSYKQLYISHIYSRRDGYIQNEFWTAFGATTMDAYRAVGGFDPSFSGAGGEDIDFGMRLTRANYRILQVPNARAQHRHHFTLVTLAKNDLKKGLSQSRNFVLGLSRLQGSRHSTTRDVWAVFSAWLLATVVSLTALASPSVTVSLALTIPLLSAYLVARHDLLSTFRQPGLGFVLLSVPTMYTLDLLRGLCVIAALVMAPFDRKSRVAASPESDISTRHSPAAPAVSRYRRSLP